MVYSGEAPYELLRSRDLDFATLQRVKRFARYWDLVANSGRFAATAPLLVEGASAFRAFLAFSDWLFARAGRAHGIALERLTRLVGEYLTTERGLDPARVGASLAADRERAAARRRSPGGGTPDAAHPPLLARPAPRLPPRQARHHR